MKKITPIKSNHPLIGKWVASDGFSDIVVNIEAVVKGFEVSVIDEADNEKAEIYDTKYEEDILSFKVHWPSNGRFVKYRFLLLSEKAIDVTYTYSGQETWLKLEP